ncbi:MAG: hypothetical protein FJ399_22700 [Verrucomicrobia bacterium]|nr:hypothetical protein [Verrucomicrobiota bacterium]
MLAFENQSGDKGNEYFSDGISDELLTQLGKVPGLRVAGRNSSFAFKGRTATDAEIAQKLGVAYLVQGTVQKAGTQVKITARLVNAADGFQVWGQILWAAGECEEAVRTLERAAALRSDVYLPNAGYRARALYDCGRKAEAVEAARLIRKLRDTPTRWHVDGYAMFILRQENHPSEVQEYLEWLFQRLPADSYVRGFVLAALGRHDEAWPYLAGMPTTLIPHLATDPIFAPMHGDARFPPLLAKLGVTEEFRTAREELARMQKARAARK